MGQRDGLQVELSDLFAMGTRRRFVRFSKNGTDILGLFFFCFGVFFTRHYITGKIINVRGLE